MMLNENPIPPSNKVVEAASNIIKQGNRYPDRMMRLKRQAGRPARREAREHRRGERLLGDDRRDDAHLHEAGRRVPLLHPDVRDVPLARRSLRRRERPDPAARARPAVRRPGDAGGGQREDQADAHHQPEQPDGHLHRRRGPHQVLRAGHPALHRRGLSGLPSAGRGQDRPRREVPARVPLAHALQGLRPGRRALRLRGRRARARRGLQPHVPALERQPHGHGGRRGHPRQPRGGQGEGQVQQRLDGQCSSGS